MPTPNFRHCALVTRFADAGTAEVAAQLAAHLVSRGLTPLILADEVSALGATSAQPLPEPELARLADLVVAIGGDGTLLYAAGLVAERGTPLLGINRGRLGFLTDVLPDDMIDCVDSALDGRCVVDQRRLLGARLQRVGGEVLEGIAINDVVLQRAQTGRLLDFETWIDGRFVNSHGGDGLVIATATGSTAYALSCGGPIVDPRLDVIVATPICPHTLSDRPIVVASDATVIVRLVDRPDTRGVITCDGRNLGPLEFGDELAVRPSPHRMTLLHPHNYDYFRLLRSKLNWGRRSFEGPR